MCRVDGPGGRRAGQRDSRGPLEFLGPRVKGLDDGRDAAAGAEVADDVCPDGIGGFDDIVEDLFGDVFGIGIFYRV